MAFKVIKHGQYLVKSEDEVWAAATHFYRHQTGKRPGKDFAASIYTIAAHCLTILNSGSGPRPGIAGFALSARPGYDVDLLYHFDEGDLQSMVDRLSL